MLLSLFYQDSEGFCRILQGFDGSWRNLRDPGGFWRILWGIFLLISTSSVKDSLRIALRSFIHVWRLPKDPAMMSMSLLDSGILERIFFAYYHITRGGFRKDRLRIVPTSSIHVWGFPKDPPKTSKMSLLDSGILERIFRVILWGTLCWLPHYSW